MHRFTECLEHNLIEFCSDGAITLLGHNSGVSAQLFSCWDCLALFNPLSAKSCLELPARNIKTA